MAAPPLIPVPEYDDITVLELCRIFPPVNTEEETLIVLPFTHFDIPWLLFNSNVMFFYNFPCSKTHFLENIVPNLKNSLSTTLGNFLPLVGNIVFPSNDLPVMHYQAKVDSVLVKIVEILNTDFDHLSGNHGREAHKLHVFVPDESPFSVQISLFPNNGICIGFYCNHAIADGATFFKFILAWATVNKFESHDSQLLLKEFLPFYDRSMVENPNGLDSKLWNHVKDLLPLQMNNNPSMPPLVKENFLTTFVMKKFDIQNLKKYVLVHNPRLLHISSFIVTCAHIWVCLIKSAQEEVLVSDDEIECFGCVVDCRARINPPLPTTYFGNCLIPVYVTLPHGKLKGGRGFLNAVEAIQDGIYKIVNNEKGILNGAETWFERQEKFNGKRVFQVAGSPTFDVYGANFGWGEPKKVECEHIVRDGAITIFNSKESKGGIEIGLSRPKNQIEAFESIFNNSLTEYSKT